MTEKAIVDGWHLEGGEWGTDVDINTSTFVSGGSSIEFKSGGAAAATLVSDWMPMDDTTQVNNNDRVYEVYALTKCSTTDVTNMIRIVVETTDSTKGTINQTTIASNYTGVSTWIAVGSAAITLPTGDTWARVRISRPLLQNFSLYIDRIYFNPSPSHLHTSLYSPNITGSFTGSWTAVNFSTAANSMYNFTSPVSISTSSMYPNKPGMYSINADVLVNSSLTAGDMLGIRLKILTYYLLLGVIATSYIYGTTLTIPANYSGEEPLPLGVSGVMNVNGFQSYLVDTLGLPSQVIVQVIQFAGTGATYENAHCSLARIPGE